LRRICGAGLEPATLTGYHCSFPGIRHGIFKSGHGDKVFWKHFPPLYPLSYRPIMSNRAGFEPATYGLTVVPKAFAMHFHFCPYQCGDEVLRNVRRMSPPKRNGL
jgi:hypothetical protein